MVSHDIYELGDRRAKRRRDRFPAAVAVRYDAKSDRIVITLSSGLELAFSPRRAQGLEHAKPSQMERIEITPSGFGIHFPKLDADLYLPALMEGFLGSRRWMASRLGALGGRSRSAAKAAASRKNGRLGGRPKKVVAR